jgi:hypothetical protein
MKKVYICGAITENENYQTDFSTAAEKIKKIGMTPVSPVEKIKIPDYLSGKNLMSRETWMFCMRRAIRLLMTCDMIYVCNNIENSLGAGWETLLADEFGIELLTDGELYDRSII